MIKPIPLKLLIIAVVIVAGMYTFYQFMTHDRTYLWSKEYKALLLERKLLAGFEPSQTIPIDTKTIKRSSLKKIKLTIQAGLSKVNLMGYNQEYGEATLFKSTNSDGYLNVKAWCVGDYLIELEIEYKEVQESTLKAIRSNLEAHFPSYQIIWTPIVH